MHSSIMLQNAALLILHLIYARVDEDGYYDKVHAKPANLFGGFSFQNLIPTFSRIMIDAKTLKGGDFDTSVQIFWDH